MIGHWPIGRCQCRPRVAIKRNAVAFLIVAGSRELAGVPVLSATAALRAGAGKVTIATGASMAPLVAIAMPECRIIGLRENSAGGFEADAVQALHSVCRDQDAVLVGPGMEDEEAVHAFTRALLPRVRCGKIVLDAYAMGVVKDGNLNFVGTHGQEGAISEGDYRLLITPHAGELAHLTGEEKKTITQTPHSAAQRAAQKWQTIVALKGAITHIATPQPRVWRHDGGNIGLGVSGSGDTLAGIIVGLSARGATLEQAAAWGVVLHARAGGRLKWRFGPLGYLPREISGEIPALMDELGPRTT